MTIPGATWRLAFQEAYRLPHASAVRRRLEAWCRWGRQGRKKLGTLFVEMEKFADPAARPWAGIPAQWQHGVTNAFKEELNRVFRAVKRRARGFRSFVYLRTMLYWVAGKLRLPALWLPTETVREPTKELRPVPRAEEW